MHSLVTSASFKWIAETHNLIFVILDHCSMSENGNLLFGNNHPYDFYSDFTVPICLSQKGRADCTNLLPLHRKSGRTNVGEFFEGAKEKSDQQGA
jgi:hypothetical protein